MIPQRGTKIRLVLIIILTWVRQASLGGYLLKIQIPNENTSDKPKLRAILQNNWPVGFKIENIIKDKD